jgi:hypothetical protein
MQWYIKRSELFLSRNTHQISIHLQLLQLDILFKWIIMKYRQYFFLIFFFLPFPCHAIVKYVSPKGSGSQNGESWDNAMAGVNLRDSMNYAQSGTAFWLMEGIYRPDSMNTLLFFQLEQGVHVYGGFTGVETSLDQRDIKGHPTLIDGSVSQNGVVSYFHRIFVLPKGGNYIQLDGLSFQNCSPVDLFNDPSIIRVIGNLDSFQSMAYITNCTFSNCELRDNASCIGVEIYDGSSFGNNLEMYIDKCSFTNIRSSNSIVSIEGNLRVNLNNCSFLNNQVINNINWFSNNGILNVSNTLIANSGKLITMAQINYITNCTFYKSQLSFNTISYLYMLNSILWNNLNSEPVYNIPNDSHIVNCNIEGGFPIGTRIMNLDPKFVDTSIGDFRIESCSPCIDTGDFVSIGNIDLGNNPRIYSTKVDLGCYESQVVGFVPLLLTLDSIVLPRCNYANSTISATVTNGGKSPTLRWYINEIPQQIGAVYRTNLLKEGDMVRCEATSDNSCSLENKVSAFLKVKFPGIPRPFPNPVSSTLNIYFPEIDNYLVQLIDMTGRILHQSTTEYSSLEILDFTRFPTGNYILTTKMEHCYQTWKIVKH